MLANAGIEVSHLEVSRLEVSRLETTTVARPYAARPYADAPQQLPPKTTHKMIVMTTLHKMTDFVYFLPFLFYLYHHLESSGTFYDDPSTPL